MEQLGCCDVAVQVEGNLRRGAQTKRSRWQREKAGGEALPRLLCVLSDKETTL
jgi:predicted PolB exonuclease-like 3'-5' exonuclease